MNTTRWARAGLMIGAMAWILGCAPSQTFTRNFAEDVGISGFELPVNTGQFVLITLENQTGEEIEVRRSYGTADGNPANDSGGLLQTIEGQRTGFFVDCAFAQNITIGDIEDLTAAPGNIIQSEAGFDPSEPRASLRIFGRLLEFGPDYICGDNVVFVFTPVPSTPGLYEGTAVVYDITPED